MHRPLMGTSTSSAGFPGPQPHSLPAPSRGAAGVLWVAGEGAGPAANTGGGQARSRAARAWSPSWRTGARGRVAGAVPEQQGGGHGGGASAWWGLAPPRMRAQVQASRLPPWPPHTPHPVPRAPSPQGPRKCFRFSFRIRRTNRAVRLTGTEDWVRADRTGPTTTASPDQP